MMKKIIVSLLLICVSMFFFYILSLKLAGTTTERKERPVKLIEFPVTDCLADVINPCTANLSDRQVRFFLPQQAHYLQAFPVQVFVSGFEQYKPQSARVRFEMSEMKMGFNQIQLVENKDNWTADAILPLCVSGQHEWMATVDIKVNDESYRAVFNFVVADKIKK